MPLKNRQESSSGAGLCEGARTLPREPYTSDTLFEREQEKIFSKLWFCAGREEEVAKPGDFFTRQLGGESLLVVRGEDARCRAFFNVCRHRGARLIGEAAGSALKRLLCPYHAWSYGLDGTLKQVPLMDETTCFDRGDYPLIEVCIESWMGFLFLNLDTAAAPHADQLEELPDLSRYQLPALRRGSRITYDVDANWKLLAENYGECYHCAIAHPQLQRVSDFRSGGTSIHGPFFTGGPMELRPGFDTMSTSGRGQLPPIPGLGAEDHRFVHYYNLYPNLLLSLHPDYVMFHTLWPEGPGRTHVICEWLFTTEAITQDGFDPVDVVGFWDLTNRQDWELCTRVQQGASSRGFRPGPFQAIEVSSYNFDRWYLDIMGSDISRELFGPKEIDR